ncbi:MAG: diadenylate cyclase CdaA [bacterium]|nr:diadenylate cyclase CdaA [bacterium]
MNLSSIWTIITKVIDICFVWIAIYFILKNVKNNTKMALIVKGVIIILIVKFISDLLNLYTVGVIIEYAIEWGPLALIVIFQPEIRNVLESIGRTQLLGRHKVLSTGEKEKVVNEIMKAMDYFRKNKIGALIVIEREVSLQEYIDNSTKIYADISDSLIESLFYPNSALHDGGVIIQGDKITCAGSVFKTSMNQNLSRKLGTRHRAALGIAEESDALALVASEETGRLSIALDSELHYNLTNEEFRTILLDELNNKSEIFFDANDVEEDQNA